MQLITTELNRVVGDLLQQLLFWQERQKATAPLKLKKRLVSGLRCLPWPGLCYRMQHFRSQSLCAHASRCRAFVEHEHERNHMGLEVWIHILPSSFLTVNSRSYIQAEFKPG